MYLLSDFEERRIEVMHELMRANPLASLVTIVDGEIVVNHMPVSVLSEAGTSGTLRGHLPRANPVWRTFSGDARATAIFHGPSCYITPSWYSAKAAHGKVVPTWNYAVVHAHGCPRVIEDADWILAHLTELTNEHESHEAVPWKITDAPSEFVARMIERLIGFEMPITSLAGKWKVSQNRSAADRRGVTVGLRSRGTDASRAIADLVSRYAEPVPEHQEKARPP